jgi:hypothetical protein
MKAICADNSRLIVKQHAYCHCYAQRAYSQTAEIYRPARREKNRKKRLLLFFLSGDPGNRAKYASNQAAFFPEITPCCTYPYPKNRWLSLSVINSP